MADKVFSEAAEEDGWVVAKHVDGKIQIAIDNADSSYQFDRSLNLDAWTTLRSTSTNEGQGKKNAETDSSNNKSYEKFQGTPLFLIRDLLNFKKVTSFSDSFLAYGKLVNVVFFCGRITDVNDKDYHQRLIIDDGTSAILALVKKRFDETNLDDTQCNDESSNERPETNNLEDNNDAHSILLEALENRVRELEEYARNDVFHRQHSLGIPVRVKGRLNEFMGKNFIFCYHIKQISEEEYLQQLHHIILIYKFGLGKCNV